MKFILTLLLFSFFSFIQAQPSFANSENKIIQTEESQVIFKELAHVLNIFNLGEIESHLTKLDKTDILSLGEAYLILSYHNYRIGMDIIGLRYFEKGFAIVNNNKNFKQNPFFETYISILNYSKTKDTKKTYSKDQVFESVFKLVEMKPNTKIQKSIKCWTMVQYLGMADNGESDFNIMSRADEDCPKTHDLQHLPVFGAVMDGFNQLSSPNSRTQYNEKMYQILINELSDPYAKLEASFTLIGAGIANRDTKLTLNTALYLRNLIIEYELLNTPLNFVSILSSAGIANMFGNDIVYRRMINKAIDLLNSQENINLYLDDFDNSYLLSGISYLREVNLEKKLLKKLQHRWNDFELNYDGEWGKLDDWLLTNIAIADYLYIFDEKDEAINILNNFLNLHDQGPAQPSLFKHKKTYSAQHLKMINEVNNMIETKSPTSKDIMPKIFKVHEKLGDYQWYNKNEKISSKHYKLAWDKIPADVKFNSFEGARILGKLLKTINIENKLTEKLKYSSLLLDIWENILFSSKNSSIISEYEKSNASRDEITFTLYTFLNSYYKKSEVDDLVQAEYSLSEAFRAIQLLRVNRLTKMYKTTNSKTALNDIKELKELTDLTNKLANNSSELTPQIPKTFSKNDLNYKFVDLKKIQSKIPWDTKIIIAYEDTTGIGFAYVDYFSFEPILSYIPKNELWRISSILASSKNNKTSFDYKNANWLYTKIFERYGSNILGKYDKNIVFIPSKSMFNFPISLLHNGKKLQTKDKFGNKEYDPNGFLIDDIYISYAVDFSNDMFGDNKDIQVTANHSSVDSSTFFAMADPFLGFNGISINRGISFINAPSQSTKKITFKSLPETLEEVNAAAQYFENKNVTILSGKKATKDNIISLPLVDYDVLMFSTHGVSPGVVEGFDGSGLLLSIPVSEKNNLSFNNRLLTPEDIRDLKLDADIVILNACNTGLADAINAPGLTGLAQSFLIAGSQSVMVSHWPISSFTTTEITKLMFENIENNSKYSFNQALTDAQLEIKSNLNTQHPFYWAPYNIYGNF
jgi:CHAT domain-containing protein